MYGIISYVLIILGLCKANNTMLIAGSLVSIASAIVYHAYQVSSDNMR